MRSAILLLGLLALKAAATVPQRAENPWEGAVTQRPAAGRDGPREMPPYLGPFCWLREYEQISDFLADWQLINPASPNHGGMIEAEAGPLGGVIQTDNTLEAIWVWSKRREWTGRTDRDGNIAAAWTYCTTHPAWQEEGGAGDNYYRAHNCAWGLAACRQYEAATGDTTRRAYARTCAAYIAQHPLPLPPTGSLNAMVTGWCAGSLYEHAAAEGRPDWREAAVQQGLDLLDFVEANPGQWLAWDEWAMSGGTMLWGLCRSVFSEAPLYGQQWLPDHVFQVPDWSDWHNVAGYDWDSAWNVAYANGLYGVRETVGDYVSAERARAITEGLLSHDTDDDGGIMADSHDPDTEDMSWVTCYLARFGLARLIGTPPGRDAGALRFLGLRDEEVVVLGTGLELSVVAANHGLEDVPGAQVVLELDGVQTMMETDLDYADLDTLFLGQWAPQQVGRHRLRAWTWCAGDEVPGNDTLAIDLVILPTPAGQPPRSVSSRLAARLFDDGRLEVRSASASPLRVELFNLLGQRLLSIEEPRVSGRLLVDWRAQAGQLPAGMYFLRAVQDGHDTIMRVPMLP